MHDEVGVIQKWLKESKSVESRNWPRSWELGVQKNIESQMIVSLSLYLRENNSASEFLSVMGLYMLLRAWICCWMLLSNGCADTTECRTTSTHQKT